MQGIGEYFNFLDSFLDRVGYFINDNVFRLDETAFPIFLFVSLMIIGFGVFILRRVLF